MLPRQLLGALAARVCTPVLSARHRDVVSLRQRFEEQFGKGSETHASSSYVGLGIAPPSAYLTA